MSPAKNAKLAGTSDWMPLFLDLRLLIAVESSAQPAHFMMSRRMKTAWQDSIRRVWMSVVERERKGERAGRCFIS